MFFFISQMPRFQIEIIEKLKNEEKKKKKKYLQFCLSAYSLVDSLL